MVIPCLSFLPTNLDLLLPLGIPLPVFACITFKGGCCIRDIDDVKVRESRHRCVLAFAASINFSIPLCVFHNLLEIRCFMQYFDIYFIQ